MVFQRPLLVTETTGLWGCSGRSYLDWLNFSPSATAEFKLEALSLRQLTQIETPSNFQPFS